MSLSTEELRQVMRSALDDPGGVLAGIRGELVAQRQATTDGRPFTDIASGVIAADGTATVLIDGPRVGQVWHLERVGFAVTGASHAANAALYLDSPAADVDLLDSIAALTGDSPSRGVFAAPGAPYLIPNGTPVVLAIAAAVVGAQVSVRYQGRVIEVQTSGGRV